MKNTVDYKSRFRILKGGKISLVVSALLVGSSLIGTSAHAVCHDTFIIDSNTSKQSITMCADTSVTVDGTLNVTNNSIALEISGPYSLTLTNNGTVSDNYYWGANAIFITDVTGLNLTNNGDINATAGEDSAGIRLYSSDLNNSSIINNSGTITVTTNNYYADAYGIVTGSLSDNASIVNSGTITVTTNDYDAHAYGIVTGSLSDNASIVNNGTLNVSSEAAIYGNASGITASSLSGDASIVNDGTMNVAADYHANGINAGTLLDTASIINSDTLTVTALRSYANGILVNTLSGSSSIQNAANATIDVMADETATGIKAVTISGNSNISNDGTINVTSTDSYTYGIFADYLVDSASIVNNGAINEIVNENAHGIYAYYMGEDSSIVNAANGVIDVNSTGSDSYGVFGWNLDGNATIVNNGTIITTAASDGYGIKNRSMDGNASITNNATIEVTADGDANGVYVQEFHGNSLLTNSGTINVTASDDGTGIYAYELYDSSSVTNSGTISVTASGNGYGTYSDSLHDYSSITNDGTIQVNAQSSGYGIYLYNPLHDYSSINNGVDGLIDVNSTYGYASGISIDSNLDTNASIVNSGVIRVNADSSRAYGIQVEGGLYDDTSILNSNTILVTAAGDAYGIHIEDGLFGNSSILNSGTITVNSGSSTAYGIYVDQISGIASIENSGTITVDGEDNSYGVHLWDILSGTATVTNTGTITALVNGELDKNGFSIYGNDFNGNNLVVTNEGTLNGNIFHRGTLTNSGLISLPHNAAGYKYAQADNFIQTATGTLEIGLFSDATLGEDSAPIMSYSQLRTNNASFADDSTIAVNVLTLSENQGLLSGQTLENVVTANNSLIMDGTLNIADNSALLNFEYFTTDMYGEDWAGNGEDGAIHLNVVEGQTILDSSIAGDGDTNTQSAAAVLDTIQDSDYPAMNPVFTALNTLPTDAAVAQAVASTTPVAATASTGATRQISNGVQRIVEMRQRANVGEGLNSGAEVFGEKNLWIKPFASFGNQANKDGMNGFDVNSAGLGFGIDAEYASNQKIGLALFYTKAYVDVNNMAQSSDLGVFSTLVYGNIPLLDDKTNFLYQLGYAWQKTDSNRHISLVGSTANADYTTNTASVDLKVIRDYSLSKNLLLQPMVEATYRNFMSPDYTETGAGVLNLKSDKFSTDELIIGVGTLAHLKLDKDSKLIANVNVGYDTYNKEGIVTTSYAGASGVLFETNGIDNGRWSYDLGLGYEKDVAEGHNINFSYNYQGEGSTFRNNVLSAKYVFSF